MQPHARRRRGAIWPSPRGWPCSEDCGIIGLSGQGAGERWSSSFSGDLLSCDALSLDRSSQLGLGGCRAANGGISYEHDGLPPRRWPWSVRLNLRGRSVFPELDPAQHVLLLVFPVLPGHGEDAICPVPVEMNHDVVGGRKRHRSARTNDDARDSSNWVADDMGLEGRLRDLARVQIPSSWRGMP